MVKMIRIDDRLLHGQVMVSWLNYLKISGILIVSDAVAKDQMRKIAINVAKPADIRLFIKNVAEGIASVEKLQGFSYDSMIIVENVADALALVKHCPSLNGITVNMGGQKMAPGRRRMADLVALSDQDIEDLKAIEALGANLEIRKLSSETPKKLKDII
jgi:mannose/fructose/N-acetylgalactosamine-specific phosphotransferase system component IIB